MRPAVAQESGNAPEDAERLDRACAFDHSHIGYFEPELIQDGLHLALRAVVVAADEHRRLDAVEVGVDHERVANATERLHEMSLGSERL